MTSLPIPVQVACVLNAREVHRHPFAGNGLTRGLTARGQTVALTSLASSHEPWSRDVEWIKCPVDLQEQQAQILVSIFRKRLPECAIFKKSDYRLEFG